MSDKVSRLRNYLRAPVGTGLLMQGLSKIAPGLSPFVQGALATGYTADAVLDFLRNKYQSPSEKRDRAQLEERASAGVARPDEQAALVGHEQKTAPIENASQIARFGLQASGGIKASQESAEQQHMQQEQHEAQLAQQEQEAAFKREQQVERDTERRNAAQKKEATVLRKEQTSERRYQEGLKRKEAARQPKPDTGISEEDIRKIDYRKEALARNPPEVIVKVLDQQFGQPKRQAYEAIRGRIGQQKAAQGAGQPQGQAISDAQLLAAMQQILNL